MSEEEIIKILNHWKVTIFVCNFEEKDRFAEAIQGILDLYNNEKEKNKALKEGLKYRINYCKLLEKELFTNGVNYKFEKTEIEKQFLE